MYVPLTTIIEATAPERPPCFDSDAAWIDWLVGAHLSGEKILRRVDVGRTRADRRAGRPGNRETWFEILPTDRIDFCADCTASRRGRMEAAGRCHPSTVATLPLPQRTVHQQLTPRRHGCAPAPAPAPAET